MRRTKAIILAAGKGVRMRSHMPKALCELSGKPMAAFLIDAVKRCGIEDITVIGGYKIELLRNKLSCYDVDIIEQRKLLGSADAVRQAARRFRGFKGTVIVLYTDTPLIKAVTIKKMLKKHKDKKAAATLLTVNIDDPKEYGRIQRDEKGRICGIVEHTEVQAAGHTNYKLQTTNYEINVGAYCFDSEKLFEGLKQIKKNKIKGEFYLTDIAGHLYNRGYSVVSYATADIDEARGINRQEELQEAEGLLRKRNIANLIGSGVVIKDPATTYIEDGAKIGRGSVIYPFVVIERDVVVGAGCKVGPFARLRSGTILDNNSEAGNFVEITRSRLGSYSRAKHHTYLGDALIGKRVNVGAGTITANYDGKKKNITTINDGAFIGSGTTIVAPVKIGKYAITGAGSVVVKGRDIPPKTVVVGVPARPIRRN